MWLESPSGTVRTEPHERQPVVVMSLLLMRLTEDLMPTSLHSRDVAAMHDVSESEDQGWICAREQTRMGRSNSASISLPFRLEFQQNVSNVLAGWHEKAVRDARRNVNDIAYSERLQLATGERGPKIFAGRRATLLPVHRSCRG